MAIGHILAAEHAEREHFARRQFRCEARREISADRLGSVVHVASLHPIVYDDPNSG